MATKNYQTMADFEAALLRAKEGLPYAAETALRNNIVTTTNAIRNRVSGTGKDGNDQSFSAYSRSHAWKRKKYGKGNLGKQVEYKGFHFTGMMWNSFKPIRYNADDKKITVTLGFIGNNLYYSNAELNEIHSAVETSKGKTPLAMPNKQEGVELTRLIGKSIGDYLNSVL